MRKFCDLLRKREAKTTIFYRNMMHDLTHNKIVQKAVDLFFEEFFKRDRWKQNSDPDSVIEDIIRSNCTELLCQGKRLGPKPIKGYARVMLAREFLKHHAQPKDNKGVSKVPSFGPPSAVRKCIKYVNHAKSKKYRINSSSKLQGFFPIVWVTDYNSLEVEKKKGTNHIRNILGLKHYAEDQQLVIVRYPDRFSVTLETKNPTVIDGGVRYIYWSEGGAGEWGKTLELGSLNPGLPEAVHSPLYISDEFSIEYAGELTVTPPQDNLNTLKNRAENNTATGCGLFSRSCKLKAASS